MVFPRSRTLIVEGRSGSDIVALVHGLRVKDLNLVVMGVVYLLELLKAWARSNPKVRFLDLEENQPNPDHPRGRGFNEWQADGCNRCGVYVGVT